MKRLIIIPAYNEEGSILKTISAIKESNCDFDQVVINDCSNDSTLKLCMENGISVINLPINLGIGGAVQTGYKYAAMNGYDYAVQIDGDGQHDPAYLGMMFDTMINEKADMVIGSRFIEKEGFQSSTARRFGISFFSGLIKLLTGVTVTDPTSGMRLVNRSIIELFARDYPRDYPEPESIVAVLKRKHKVVECPVVMKKRQAGQSSINIRSSVYYMIKVSIAIIMERIR